MCMELSVLAVTNQFFCIKQEVSFLIEPATFIFAQQHSKQISRCGLQLFQCLDLAVHLQHGVHLQSLVLDLHRHQDALRIQQRVVRFLHILHGYSPNKVIQHPLLDLHALQEPAQALDHLQQLHRVQQLYKLPVHQSHQLGILLVDLGEKPACHSHVESFELVQLGGDDFLDEGDSGRVEGLLAGVGPQNQTDVTDGGAGPRKVLLQPELNGFPECGIHLKGLHTHCPHNSTYVLDCILSESPLDDLHYSLEEQLVCLDFPVSCVSTLALSGDYREGPTGSTHIFRSHGMHLVQQLLLHPPDHILSQYPVLHSHAIQQGTQPLWHLIRVEERYELLDDRPLLPAHISGDLQQLFDLLLLPVREALDDHILDVLSQVLLEHVQFHVTVEDTHKLSCGKVLEEDSEPVGHRFKDTQFGLHVLAGVVGVVGDHLDQLVPVHGLDVPDQMPHDGFEEGVVAQLFETVIVQDPEQERILTDLHAIKVFDHPVLQGTSHVQVGFQQEPDLLQRELLIVQPSPSHFDLLRGDSTPCIQEEEQFDTVVGVHKKKSVDIAGERGGEGG